MLRQRKSYKERSCRDIVLYVATLKEDNSYDDKKNDVTTRNDFLMTDQVLTKEFGVAT